MKPLLLDVKSLLKDSIYVKELILPHLEDQFHYHNACEISYIMKSRGRRVVGDNIEDFTEGDLTLMAPHVPHISYTDQECNLSENVHALVVYFHPDWLTDNHFNSPELIKVRNLLENMKRGLKIYGQTQKKVVRSLFKLKRCHGLERIVTLLDILVVISNSDEYVCLASEAYAQPADQSDDRRINEVYRYVRQHFRNKIMLEEIASIANMTPTAFCKYFKNRTNKTFSHFVNEVRIGHACKQLCSVDLSISQICYDAGFNNLTNFNKTFKQITKMIPSEYKHHLQNKGKRLAS